MHIYIALISTFTVTLLAVVDIVKKGINRNAAIMTIFVSSMLLMFLIRGRPMYLTAIFIMSVPVIIYYIMNFFLGNKGNFRK